MQESDSTKTAGENPVFQPYHERSVGDPSRTDRLEHKWRSVATSNMIRMWALRKSGIVERIGKTSHNVYT